MTMSPTQPLPPQPQVAGAVSDAAGKAVAGGVAGQALPELYVPGSGDRVPAELRLVLGRYIGIACGLFASALACATAFTFLFLYVSLPLGARPNFFADDIYVANDMQGCCSAWPSRRFVVGLGRGFGLGL
jgi:hypothetical protein